MVFSFRCPSCGATIQVSDKRAGGRGRCPHCHAKVDVPQVHEAGEALAVHDVNAPTSGTTHGPPIAPAPAQPRAGGAVEAPGAAHASSWYVAFGNQRHGPYPHEQLIGWIAEGRMPPDALAWREGMASWEHWKAVPELHAAGAGRSASSPRRHSRLGQHLKRVASEPLILLMLRNPEAAFRTADGQGGGAGQVALLGLAAAAILGILVFVPAVVKGEAFITSGFMGDSSLGGFESEWGFDAGMPFRMGRESRGPSVAGIIIRELTPRMLVVELLVCGTILGLTAGCLGLMGTGPRVLPRTLCIVGLPAIPLAAVLALVFLFAWLHWLFYLLLACGGLLWAFCYYQGLRTLGRLDSAKATYCATLVLFVTVILDIILYVSSW